MNNKWHEFVSLGASNTLDIDLMYVNGSGWDMTTIDRSGALRAASVRELDSLAETVVVNERCDHRKLSIGPDTESRALL